MNIISCPSCGASVEFDLESKTVQCDYCSLEIDLNTSLFEKEIIFTGNKKDQSSFLNLAQLLHNSRKAENYNLAYDYCNQLVKLNPKNDVLWEIKAQIFFLKLSTNFDQKNLKSIFTFYEGYLNSSKKPSLTFKKIFKNLYNAFLIKYNKLEFDKSLSGKVWDSFSNESIKLLINFIKISEEQFKQTSDISLLEKIILELSGQKKNYWLTTVDGKVTNYEWCKDFNFNPLKKRSELIKTIKEVNPNYKEPDVNYKNIGNSNLNTTNGSCYIATICYNNINHDDIIVLRKFRDKFLLNNMIGRMFVKSYYYSSPKITLLLKKYKFFSVYLKRWVLKPLVKIMHNNLKIK